SDTQAVRNSSSSSASAGTSVSGTKRPPYSPKRPSPSGSGPGGSRCTGRPRAGAVIGSWYESGPVGHPVIRRGLGVGNPAVAAQLVAGCPRLVDEPSELARALVPRARRGLDAGRDVDTPGPPPPDRLPDVLTVEATREHEAHTRRHRVGECPIEGG